MNISKTGIQLVKDFEGLRRNAYKCSAGVPTIGYGSTVYPDKSNVKMGDVLRDTSEAEVFSIINWNQHGQIASPVSIGWLSIT